MYASASPGLLWKVVDRLGVPVAILAVMFGMFTGWIPSPVSEAAHYAKANFEILADRNRIFEEMIYFEANVCVRTAHNSTEEQLCFTAVNNACRELDRVKEAVEKARGDRTRE